MKIDLDLVERNLQNGNYLPEQLPPYMLAMIARIRDLEMACRCSVTALRMYSKESPTASQTDLILEMGAVLP